MHEIDPIVLSLIQNRLDNISVQMGGVMLRTARSPIFSQSHDFSCFLTDTNGSLISQADGIPIHSGGGGVAVRAMLEAFDDMNPGDVFLSNDPYVAGGNHLPDWVIARPVYVEGQRIAFSCIRAHQADIGGGMAGTYNPHATEIFHEGVRLPPLRLVESGQIKKDLWALLMLNTRLPEDVDGDVRAMLGATQIGAQKIEELAHNYGIEHVARYFEKVLDQGEEALARLIRSLPDGVYHAQEHLLNDCFEDREIMIRVALEKKDGHLTVDFTGTDPQIKGFKNSSLANTYSAVYAGVASYFDADLPRNEGTFRNITIIAPLGTLINPRHPAPMTLCTATPAHEIMHAVWLALGQAAPQYGLAGWGKNAFPITSGTRSNGNVWAMYHWGSCSGTGATGDRDGFIQLGGLGTLGGLMLPNAESSEQSYPVRVMRQEVRTDGGGAGMHRGGSGVIYEVEIDESAEYVLRGEGFGPPSGLGAAGGQTGAGGTVIIKSREGSAYDVPAFGSVVTQGPSHLIVKSPGGGGFGNPKLRNSELVRDDVLNGFVSFEAAKSIYGVVVNDSYEIDYSKTEQLRSCDVKATA